MKPFKVNDGVAWLNSGIGQSHMSCQTWEKYIFEIELKLDVFKPQNLNCEYSLGAFLQELFQIGQITGQILLNAADTSIGWWNYHEAWLQWSFINLKMKTIFLSLQRKCMQQLSSSCCVAVVPMKDAVLWWVLQMCWVLCQQLRWVWHCNLHPSQRLFMQWCHAPVWHFVGQAYS